MEKSRLKSYFVYILQSNNSNVIYIGVTNNLIRRVFEHKNKLIKGFSSKYNCQKLIYYEVTNSVESAILREKQLKRWSRGKKNNLILTMNKNFSDLSTSLEMTDR